MSTEYKVITTTFEVTGKQIVLSSDCFEDCINVVLALASSYNTRTIAIVNHNGTALFWAKKVVFGAVWSVIETISNNYLRAKMSWGSSDNFDYIFDI